MNDMLMSISGGAQVEATVEVAAACLCRCADGVVEVRVRDGAVIGVREMEGILAALLALAQGPVVVLVDGRPVKRMAREAQELIAETAHERNTIAVAILVEGAVSAFLGNLFLEVAGRAYPTKLFRSPEQARAWLLPHLDAILAG